MLIKFTGLGCLTPVMVLVALFLGVALGGTVASDDFPNAAGGLVIVAVLLVAAPVHWLVGMALNSARTPQGRVWHNRHTYNGQPMQLGAVVDVVFALFGLAFVAGAATSPLVGWAVFIGGLVAALVAYVRYNSRRRLGSVADRKDLARARGWRYEDTDALVTRRWKDLYGRQVYAMNPFGIVAGELGGLAFTVFDTETSVEGATATTRERLRSTVWAVHLSVAYPRMAMWGFTPDAAERFRAGWSRQDLVVHGLVTAFTGQWQGASGTELVPDAEDTAFAQALWTAGVCQTTIQHQLFDWRIEGRDLILTRSRETPYRAEEIVQVAERLVALVRQFPVDLATRFGSAPTTEVLFAVA